MEKGPAGRLNPWPGNMPEHPERPDIPGARLRAELSLWSADLANLAAAIERVEPFADSFHLDISDGRFTPSLLFFPDLVRALRSHTNLPFHIHLMVERPTNLIGDFVAAGADTITVHLESGKAEATAAIEAVRCAGRSVGLALRLETPIAAVQPYLSHIECLLLLGTEPGVKGRELAPQACARLAEARRMRDGGHARVLLVADGGIRRHTVPLLRRAGADVVVLGSLVFQSEDLEETFRWLRAV